MSTDRHEIELANLYRSRGLHEGMFRTEGEMRAMVKIIERDPAYLDGKHPEHARAVADASRLYAELHPEPGAED